MHFECLDPSNGFALNETCAWEKGVSLAAAAGTASKEEYRSALALLRKLQPFTNAIGLDPGETLQDIGAVVNLCAHMLENVFLKSTCDFYFDKHFSLENPISVYTRSVILFGSPLAGYNNPDDRMDDQAEEIKVFFQEEYQQFLFERGKGSENVDIIFFSTPLFLDEFLAILFRDVSLAGLSMVLVFGWLWYQTGSLIIAIIRLIPESSGRPSSWSELITSFSAPLLFSSSLPSRSPTMSWSSFPSLSSRKRARSAALSPRRPCSTSIRTPLLPELAVLKR